ncbi:hypothetical protein B5X24_HaOG200994 [Helicoverpa armigera]|nr:hypothetical protein B5X24_HaOG200994 [Helicoverpa armigera]
MHNLQPKKMLKMKKIIQKREKSFDQPNRIGFDYQLDKELHQIVNSFNFALNLCFSSKYYVQSNHIEARGMKYRLLTSCYTIIMGLLCIYRIVTADIRDALMSYSENCFLRFLSGLYYTDYLLGFILCYILDIVHSHNHIILVAIFKVIHRSIDCSKIVSRFIIWNWITLCTTICIDLFIYVMYYGFFARFSLIENISDCLCDVMFITFYINYIIAIRVIILLKVYLDEWILNIRNLSNGLDRDEVCLKLIRVYNDIMKAYDLYKSIYQLLVSSLMNHLFQKFSVAFLRECFIFADSNSRTGHIFAKFNVLLSDHHKPQEECTGRR